MSNLLETTETNALRRSNPFVGLRPFNTDESLLFFRRRQQTVELLEQLHQTHFIGVVGSSGCGKSSLIRAGLIPKLLAGFLVEARDAWRIATLKPGDAPLRNLAAALSESADPAAIGQLQHAIKEGGAQAMLDHLAPALSAANANLLLLVDQFEELFRFGIESGKPEQRDEAADFVALLLQLAEQRSVYVVLTMRSDFLGDCDHFHGLPEALNRSQYLVPRLTREQRRQAIEGPVRLFGAEIAPRLLDRLLNDVGDQSDQLPVLQHALMRTWDWREFDEAKRKRDWAGPGEFTALPLDVPQYLEAGTIKDALTKDAEAALNSLSADEQKWAERMFRALTATDANNRKIRRPAHLSELCAITGATEEDVRTIIERFRANHRSFLLLSNEADPLVDISHESLIRQWPRADEWIENEEESVASFKRLVDATRRKRELWRGVDLDEGRKWFSENKPNVAWAMRYENDPHALDSALSFLNQSAKAASQRKRELKARQKLVAAQQQRELWRARAIAILVSITTLLAIGFAFYAFRQQRLSRLQNYDTSMFFAYKSFDENNVLLGQELLSSFLPSTRSFVRFVEGDVRGFDWYYLWRNSHQELKTFKQEDVSVYSVVFAPDGKMLASANWADIILWDAQTGQIIHTLKGHKGFVRSIACASDGRTLASASWDGTVKLWDLQSGKELATLTTDRFRMDSVAYAPDGKTLASVNADGTVKIWDTQNRNELLTLKVEGYGFYSIAFAPDGGTLASASLDGTVRIWSTRNGHELLAMNKEGASIFSVAYAPNGQVLATAGGDGTVKLWDAHDGKELQTFKGHSDGVMSLTYSSNGEVLVTGSDDGTVKLWDVRDGKEVRTLKGHGEEVLSVAIAADGNTLASSSRDGTVKLWDIQGDQGLRSLKGHDEKVLFLIYKSDGETLASGSSNGTIKFWNILSGQELQTLKLQTGTCTALVFASDGKTVASIDVEGAVKLWDMRNGQLLQTLQEGEGTISSIAFAPNNQVLASANSDNIVKLWDASSGKELGGLKGHTSSVRLVAYEPSGQTLASASYDGTVIIWDAQTWEKLRTLDRRSSIAEFVVYALDGKTLACVYIDKTITLWDARSGEQLQTLKGHLSDILSVSFAPDGKTLASAGVDGTVKLWNVRSGQELGTLKGHTGSIRTLAFAPDGKTLVSAGGDDNGKKDYSIRLWYAATDDEVARQRNR